METIGNIGVIKRLYVLLFPGSTGNLSDAPMMPVVSAAGMLA